MGIIPTALKNKPKLRPDCAGYFEGFQVLSGTRGYAHGPLPIQMVEMESYCRMFGVAAGDPTRRFVRLVMTLDSAYLNAAAKKAEADRKLTK